ncbi:protein phosphatase 2c [Pseudohyphozyma bogoriensis]|nr:protein phosphatase 2c [Pseudohyphozyma bogoriensis]
MSQPTAKSATKLLHHISRRVGTNAKYVVRSTAAVASSDSATGPAPSPAVGGSGGACCVVIHKRGVSSSASSSKSAGGASLHRSGSNSGQHARRDDRTLLSRSSGKPQAPSSSSPASSFFTSAPHPRHFTNAPQPAPSPPDSSVSFQSTPKHPPTPSTASESSLIPSPPYAQIPYLSLGANSSSTSPAASQNSSSSSNNSLDRATLFTPSSAHSYAPPPLPSFFGAALSIARRRNLVFRNGAYGIPKVSLSTDDGKGKEKERDSNELEHALSVSVGEDAYFLRTDSLGVADGVGGWSGHAGANPARWSRKFMHNCSAELARYENVDDELFLQYYEIDPVDVLQRAFEKTLAECKDEGVIGSSTALIAVLRNDELRLANLGDCCCSIIRGQDYVFRSEEQQHAFNFPFQAGTNSKDTPIKDAQRFNIKVQKDDIVILSSDGLLDNIFDGDLLEEVLRFVATSSPPTSSIPIPGSRYTLNRFSPQAVSEALCHRARSVYEDPHAVASPFQQRAVGKGIPFAGGKRDDITTLIGVVGELEASPDRR